MSALKRQLLRGSCACAALALAGCPASPPDDSGAAYRAWLTQRVRAAQAGTGPRDAAITAALRQHLCDADTTCFPQAEWQALDRRANVSTDPAILSLMTSIDSLRNEQRADAARWAHVAEADPGNAYPIVMRAGAEWHAGHHAEALNILRTAIDQPRYEDQFAATAKLLFPVVNAQVPSREQIHPCAVFSPSGSVPGELERSATATMHVAIDFAPAPFGDLVALCKPTDPEVESTQRELCQAIGTQMEHRATDVLSRAIGFGLQHLSSADTSAQAAIDARRDAAMDDYQRKSWWTDVDPDATARDAAVAYWFERFMQSGELAAADAVVQHFGEPPPESAENRRRRFETRMQQGQQCYARLHHEPH